MHTDEYEISLLREVGVCSGSIRALQHTLQRLEKKYHLTSEEVIKGDGASARVDGRDRQQWLESYRELISWQKRKTEFEELYHQMKR